MKILKDFTAILDAGFADEVFKHLRNFIMCTLILAIGTNELKVQSSLLFGLIPSNVSGIGVLGLALILITLNLTDGIRKISKAKYQKVFTILLIVVYITFSIRVVEMAWNFRVTF